MPPFFFIISNSKFLRVDLDKIVCVVKTSDGVQVHTNNAIYEPVVTMDELKSVLPEDLFTYVNPKLVVAKAIGE